MQAVYPSIVDVVDEADGAVPVHWTFSCPKGGVYQIFVASSLATRGRAQVLMNNVYQARGYTKNNDEIGHFNKAKTNDSIFTLLVEDARGEAAGTVSLRVDSSDGLPCDEIFNQEVAAMRKQGQRVAEVTGLAVSAKHTRSKLLLVHLMDFVLIVARRISQASTVLIEVNPRHENFYRRLLKFEEAGPVRACHRVQGAPARLLRLDMARQREMVRAEAVPRNAIRNSKSRSLYAHFYTLDEELLITRFLKYSAAKDMVSSPLDIRAPGV